MLYKALYSVYTDTGDAFRLSFQPWLSLRNILSIKLLTSTLTLAMASGFHFNRGQGSEMFSEMFEV